jgi:hypothetical protein
MSRPTGAERECEPAIDLADDTPMLIVVDHDLKVLARRMLWRMLRRRGWAGALTGRHGRAARQGGTAGCVGRVRG